VYTRREAEHLPGPLIVDFEEDPPDPGWHTHNELSITVELSPKRLTRQNRRIGAPRRATGLANLLISVRVLCMSWEGASA